MTTKFKEIREEQERILKNRGRDINACGNCKHWRPLYPWEYPEYLLNPMNCVLGRCSKVPEGLTCEGEIDGEKAVWTFDPDVFDDEVCDEVYGCFEEKDK